MTLLRASTRTVFALVIGVIVLTLRFNISNVHDENRLRFISRSLHHESDFIPLHDDIPETTWVTGIAGFNYFQNLYSVSGGFIAVTSHPETFPDEGVGFIISAAPGADDDGWYHPVAEPDLWRIVSPQEARGLLGDVAVRKAGISMYFNDMSGNRTPAFLDHYFHFIGEVFLAAWRLVASSGEHELPARLMFRGAPHDWRDRARLTPGFQQAVMPTTAIEDYIILEDRAKSGLTFLYDQITICDRWSAHRLGNETNWSHKATADVLSLGVSKDWLRPLRDSIKRLVLAEGCSIERRKPTVPIVTYINRQLTGRRLLTSDHKELVDEMLAMKDQGLIEFSDAVMERMSLTQQLCMAVRTDIMIGVHGNGLSHQLWMKPGSGVLEFMDVGGFTRDYSLLADLAGHDYHAIHRDRIFPRSEWRQPDGWAVEQSPGFHGPNIRVDASFVGTLVKNMAEDKRHLHESSL